MKKYPKIITLERLVLEMKDPLVHINEKWVPCRSEGLSSFKNKLKCAWLVFTGKADALVWPEGQ